jgi:ADP-ribose pyrophosphatase
MHKKPMILVAGPYRSGTGDDPAKIAANLQKMNEIALILLQKGFIPMVGEWMALPLIATAGSTTVGDAAFEQIFHSSAIDLLAHCDAVLRIGGASQGADLMVDYAQNWNKPVFFSLEEVHFTKA